jgi:hypothetical protein
LFADFLQEAVGAFEELFDLRARHFGEGAGLGAERALEQDGFFEHGQEVVGAALAEGGFVELFFAHGGFEVDQDALER